jgi:phospholipid transport system transporter-binding protein
MRVQGILLSMVISLFLRWIKKTVSSFAFLTTSKQITVDLGGVGNADSAGLALMIEWVKYSRSKRVQLRFRNIPEQLLNLAKLSGLDKTSYFISAKSGLAVTE